MSKCYQASQATANPMRCITCHDPHIELTAAEAPAFFNGKCLSCHTEQSCKAPIDARRATAVVADNCVSCHMQKREGVAITHTSITNHRIVARADEPFPEIAFNQTTAALPDLIHLDRTPGETAAPPAITLLQAYDQLKEQNPAYNAPWLRTLGELERTDPESAIVQAALGRRALKDGRLSEAAGHFEASLRLDQAQPANYAALSDIADQQGRTAEALEFARRAVMLDPYNMPMRKALVSRLINAKQYQEAESAMEKYLQDFPEDDFMRKMLAIAKSD
jgi:Tfp pilus assembly protein PilF